jgi:dTDP-4-dehydrorhamnose reductase
MRVLVTGSSGMLGKDVCESLGFHNHEVFGVSKDSNVNMKKDRQFLGDLANDAFINGVLEDCQPDAIIHCAAIVNVDECEKNRELADSVHIEVTSKLAAYKAGEVRFIYVSTDSVFDGNVGNYSEEDSPHPLNYYALTKLQGERLALGNNPNSVVLRTNIFGFHVPPGRSLAEWAIHNLLLNKTINGFDDVLFNPVYTKQLSLMTAKYFMSSDLRGVWNVASQGYLSKYEFLVRLAGVFKVPASLVVQKSMTSATFIASRPKRTFLNTDKLKSRLGVVLDLQRGLENMKTDYSTYVESRT